MSAAQSVAPSGTTGTDVITPPPAREAVPEVAMSGLRMLRLLAGGRLTHPRARKDLLLTFADGSTSRVYRETRVDDGRAADPVVLVVGFVLRGVRGRLGHAAFRAESWLNTPMFVGFPGFTSKLWMTADEHGVYRGLYEWDGADRAWHYVHALSWVLGLVSVPGSIRAHVGPALRRDDVLARPEALGAPSDEEDRWWRPVVLHAA
jgi:hypothetical protein